MDEDNQQLVGEIANYFIPHARKEVVKVIWVKYLFQLFIRRRLLLLSLSKNILTYYNTMATHLGNKTWKHHTGIRRYGNYSRTNISGDCSTIWFDKVWLSWVFNLDFQCPLYSSLCRTSSSTNQIERVGLRRETVLSCNE